jgi:LPXTG-motif cell wall-anchored protein
LIDPIIEYQNSQVEGGLGRVVVGGMIYRGSNLSQFQGRYIFGDWSTSFGEANGTLLVATPSGTAGELWPFQEVSIAGRENGRLNTYLLSFGQDANLELYILTSDTAGPSGDTGKALRIVPAPSEAPPAETETETETPEALPETGGPSTPWIAMLTVGAGLLLMFAGGFLVRRRQGQDVQIED